MNVMNSSTTEVLSLQVLNHAAAIVSAKRLRPVKRLLRECRIRVSPSKTAKVHYILEKFESSHVY